MPNGHIQAGKSSYKVVIEYVYIDYEMIKS